MKIFFLLIAIVTVCAQTWQTVTINAPPTNCCQGQWESSCDVLSNAIHSAKAYTQLELASGTYCNAKYTTVHSQLADYTHGTIVSIHSRQHLKLIAQDANNPPNFIFDGQGAILVANSDDVTIQGFEVSGPSLRITGEEATQNRQRRTGRNSNGCSRHWQAHCSSVSGCEWDSALSSCIGVSYTYYVGTGIQVNNSTNIVIDSNKVHHCPGGGIHCDVCDNTNITNNIVYGNTWWTTNAPSGVVFSNALGTGTNTMKNNVVYGNRNFMPLYLTSEPAHGGAANPDYGAWNQSYIIDGQGVYITRCPDYQGTFELSKNVAFDNGINGLVVHKTTNAAVSVTVDFNNIFDNGKTSTQWEHRQDAGGIVVNSGTAAYTARLQLEDNFVEANALPDRTYQCFGTCILGDQSQGNTWCGGKYSSSFDQSAFTSTNCDEQEKILAHYRTNNPPSQMPTCPQYTPFINVSGYNCVEPESDLAYK